jgi:hypothetical protein
MARYQRPPDPRNRDRDNDRPVLQSDQDQGRTPIPWLWLGLGMVVTVLGIGLAVLLIAAFLDREPLLTTLPTPTIIRLTAPSSPVPTGTNSLSAATQIPTFTPPATADLSISPNELTIGFYAQVYNTDDIGVSLRGGPSTDNVRLQLIPEGSFVVVIGGPEEGDGFPWWQVVAEGEVEGWIAGDFLTPAPSPSDDN